MIKGIGTDIIEVARIAANIETHDQKFLDRVFTAKEQTYCKQHKESNRHFAGRFAAKEAIVKALGIGLSQGLGWLDIEILNDEHGKPYLNPSSKLMDKFDVNGLHVSISHCQKYATATAVWEK